MKKIIAAIFLIITAYAHNNLCMEIENNKKIITYTPQQHIKLCAGITNIELNTIGELTLRQMAESENNLFYEHFNIAHYSERNTPVDVSPFQIIQNLETNTLTINGNNSQFLKYYLSLRNITYITLRNHINMTVNTITNPKRLVIDLGKNCTAHIAKLQASKILIRQQQQSNLTIKEILAKKRISITSEYNSIDLMTFIGKKIETNDACFETNSMNLSANIIVHNQLVSLPGLNSYINLSGEAKEQTVFCRGTSSYDAFSLKTSKTTVKNQNYKEGSSIKIWATDELNVDMKTGELFYKESPTNLLINHTDNSSIYSCNQQSKK